MHNKLNPTDLSILDEGQNELWMIQITDGGFYECPEVIEGSYIKLKRSPNSVFNTYIFQTIRAYAG